MAAMLALALLLSSVHIRLDQDGGLTAAQVRVVVDQMREIWASAGVGFTCGNHDGPSGPGEASVSLRILRSAAAPTGGGGAILAWTVIDRVQGSGPVLLVSLPAITTLLSRAEFAGYRVDRLTIEVRDELIARAIGRVAAHELGHHLLQQAGHQDRGLMRRTFSPADLVGTWLGPFRVAEDQWVIVRAEIAALAHSQSAF
jgi:hypothetical protein